MKNRFSLSQLPNFPAMFCCSEIFLIWKIAENSLNGYYFVFILLAKITSLKQGLDVEFLVLQEIQNCVWQGRSKLGSLPINWFELCRNIFAAHITVSFLSCKDLSNNLPKTELRAQQKHCKCISALFSTRWTFTFVTVILQTQFQFHSYSRSCTHTHKTIL